MLEYSNTKMNLNCNFVSYKTLGVNSQWVLEARTIKLVVLIQSKSTRNYNWYGTTMKNIFLDEILSIFFGVSPSPLVKTDILIKLEHILFRFYKWNCKYSSFGFIYFRKGQPVRDWFPYLWLYFAKFIDDTARFVLFSI